MAEHFTLEIIYQGRTHIVESELRQLGFTHKIYMKVNEMEVIFEPDEERNYRVILEKPGDVDRIDKGLVGAIKEELEKALNK